MTGAPERVLRGNVDRVGLPGTKLTFEDAVPEDGSTGDRGTLDHAAAAGLLLDRVDARVGLASVTAAGHRVGGVDTLIFAGGIGENAPAIRARICEGLAFLGIELDSRRNDVGEGIVSSDASRAGVRVIRTDDEVMIARAVGEASTASGVIGATHFGRKP